MLNLTNKLQITMTKQFVSMSELSETPDATVQQLFDSRQNTNVQHAQWPITSIADASKTLGDYQWLKACTQQQKCTEPDSLMVVTHSQETCTRNLHKFFCASFLHQIFVQVHASSADDTSNKNRRSWTRQITFSILSVDHSMGTQNFNLNNFKK